MYSGAVPCYWILDENGNVVYGSVTGETKEALSKLHDLYEKGILGSKIPSEKNRKYR